MRHVITTFFLLIVLVSFGQNKNKFSLLLQVQPELTFHKNDYAFRWTDKKTLSTANCGLTASLQYKLSERFFADFGVGFIARKLNTKVFLDQSLLPPPYYDSTKPLYITKSVAFRTLQLPLGLGYDFIKTKKTNVFIKGTYIPNFILNTKYATGNYPAFKKDTWQGYSINVGAGLDYFIKKDITFTGLLNYSIKNTVARDDYTFSQDDRRIALTHTYLQLSIGVKINL